MKNKTLKFILVGILLFVTILAIEFCCIYALLGDNTWNYIKDFWNWYAMFIIDIRNK